MGKSPKNIAITPERENASTRPRVLARKRRRDNARMKKPFLNTLAGLGSIIHARTRYRVLARSRQREKAMTRYRGQEFFLISDFRLSALPCLDRHIHDGKPHPRDNAKSRYRENEKDSMRGVEADSVARQTCEFLRARDDARSRHRDNAAEPK